MIVDDSVVVRRVIVDALRIDPEIDIVGTANNGVTALEMARAVQPDIFTMDIEMPEMDGIEAVRQLRRRGYHQPIVMFSTLTERGAEATFEALAAGATDYMTKPSQVRDVQDTIQRVREGLIPRIKALVPLVRSEPDPSPTPPPPPVPAPRIVTTSVATRPAPRPRLRPVQEAPPAPAPVPEATPAAPARTAPRRAPAFDVIAVGCSTGGPEALTTFLSGLPQDLQVPIVVVQHMPPVFTAQFAQRLDRQLPLRVVEAAAPEALRAGTVYIAPGDYHLEVHRRQGALWTRTTQAPPENFCRPAVDVMLRSLVPVCGNRTLAVILTGMGSDGRIGCEAVHRAGGVVMAQDAATSVVWGMPGAVVNSGLAEQVLPLNQLALAVRNRLEPALVGEL